MSGFRRPNPPADVRKQIGRLTQGLEAALRQALVGIYLHGSLALGCFNRDLSDIDLLVVTRRRTTKDEQRQAVALLLASSGEPSSVELSVLAEEDLEPWRYPTPYDFITPSHCEPSSRPAASRAAATTTTYPRTSR